MTRSMIRRMTRSILAVLAGWAIVGVLVVCTDAVLNRLYPTLYVEGKIPPDWLSAVSLFTSTLWSVVGGWVTARIAAANPWRHILGLIIWGEIMGFASLFLTMGKIQLWYLIGLLVLWMPAVALGGWIRAGKPTLKPAAGV